MLEELVVMDPETMQPVPRDGETIGEIMFRGNIVMKGYLKNPEASRKAFADGYFHSGDLAVCHPDGYIEIKDRSKDIIISGGENISSIEVEGMLYRHPAVLEAAVAAMPDDKWGETPCAFVTLRDDAGDVSEQEIIDFCRDKWRISRRRARWCSARCRKPRPARSRNSNCANAPNNYERPISTTLRRILVENKRVAIVGPVRRLVAAEQFCRQVPARARFRTDSRSTRSTTRSSGRNVTPT